MIFDLFYFSQVGRICRCLFNKGFVAGLKLLFVCFIIIELLMSSLMI